MLDSIEPAGPGLAPMVSFPTQIGWEEWLRDNHARPSGIWLRLYKKNSGHPSVTYEEAVELALIYGWIDSKVKKYDGLSYIQWFSPRRPRSLWSSSNRQKVEKLMAEGRMKPSGIAAVEAAKQNGQWDAAYGSNPSSPPDDFQQALAACPAALSTFEALSQSGQSLYIHWVMSAKRPETRARRIRAAVEKLEAGKRVDE